jgi:hypothetical protein
MKAWLMRIGVMALVGVVALSGVGSVAAQDPDSDLPAGDPAGPKPIGPRAFVAAVTEATGLSGDEIRALLDEGKTLAEIAEENGVDPDEISGAVLDTLAEHLATQVSEGHLTQEEADQLLGDAGNLMSLPIEEWPQPSGQGQGEPGRPRPGQDGSGQTV